MRRLHLLLAAPVLVLAFALLGCGDDDEGGGSVASFCEESSRADDAPDPLSLESDDVEGAKDAGGEFEDILNGLVDAAPDEISGDVAEVRDYIGSFNDAIADVETPEDLTQAKEDFRRDNPTPDATLEKLGRYTDENCGSGEDTAG